MNAVRWHGRGDLRHERIPLPLPGYDEALIRVGWVGICGTDVEEYRAGPLTIPVEPHVSSGRSAPLTLGHEIVGQVVLAAGDGTGPAVGQWVVPDVVQGCGQCWWCGAHEEGLCPRLTVLGQTDDGGLADYLVAKAARCLVVPAGLEPRSAALAEPLAVAVRAVSKLTLRPDSVVAVVGGGTIGQLTALVLSRSSPAGVVVVDPMPERRALATRLSGAIALSPEDFAPYVSTMPEPGLDAVIECAGRPGLIEESLHAVRPGGTVVAVGLRSGFEPIEVPHLVLGERTLVGSAAHMWDTDVAAALELLGRVDLSELITHEFDLRDARDAFDLVASGDRSVLKVVIAAG